MSRHADALVALAIAIVVHPKFIHSFIVKCEPLLTLVEAILGRMRRNTAAVLTVTGAESFEVILEMRTVVILFYFYDRFQ